MRSITGAASDGAIFSPTKPANVIHMDSVPDIKISCQVTRFNQLNLTGLKRVGHSGVAGLLAVLCPRHPADVGGVDALVDVVVPGEGPREPQSHRLDGASLAGGAAL